MKEKLFKVIVCLMMCTCLIGCGTDEETPKDTSGTDTSDLIAVGGEENTETTENTETDKTEDKKDDTENKKPSGTSTENKKDTTSSSSKPSGSTGSTGSTGSSSKPSGDTSTTKPSGGTGNSGNTGSSNSGNSGNSGSTSKPEQKPTTPPKEDKPVTPPKDDKPSTPEPKPEPPKEETPKPQPPAPSWAMSEAQMIAYAKSVITNYKPTSGYGRVIWEESFTKTNSGWFAPRTISINMSTEEIKEIIKGAVSSTLRKATDVMFDDGKGNVNYNPVYCGKGYLEKVDSNTYEFYTFY